MSKPILRRTAHRLLHDPSRVIAKPYLPGEEISADASNRADLLMARILAIPEGEVSAWILQETVVRFGARATAGSEELLEHHFSLVAHRVGATPRSLLARAGSSSGPTSPTSTPSKARRSSIHPSCLLPIRRA